MIVEANLIYGGLMMISFLVIIMIISIYVKKVNSLKYDKDYADYLIRNLSPFSGLEKNLDLFLEKIEEVIEAPGYAFYIYDDKNHKFVLKAVRHMVDSEGQIAPSYSGLVPYKKEVYNPPMSLPFEAYGERVKKISEGEVPILTVPVKGGKALIRIGPVQKVQSKTINQLHMISQKLENPIHILLSVEQIMTESNVLSTSGRAVQYISQMMMKQEETIQTLMQLSIKAYGISRGFLLVKYHHHFNIPVSVGLPQSLKENLIHEREEDLQQIFQLTENRAFSVLDRDDYLFEQFPSAVINEGVSQIVLSKVTYQNKVGVLVFLLEENMDQSDQDRITTIKTTVHHLTQFIKFQENSPFLYQASSNMLCMLSDMIDNLSPYTVGYSELMRRYSMAVAKEMGLDDNQVKQIGLAAYLSNIGVLGLSDDLFYKEGKYSEVEYEQMKLHAEVGAVIVESTLANDQVAAFIRHHHERMDGNGYPYGLKGEEIPIGARILAVVQTFLAKINGRSYREPLFFEQALEILESASGSQLDPQVVEAFIGWFRKKQSNPLIEGRSLGPCWEMNCVPSTICMQCPAYGKKDMNCWEFESNNCKAHGKQCNTCIVYTEAKARKSQLDRLA